MAGIADGWNVEELNRGFGQLYVGLAVPAVDSVMVFDFADGAPDSASNPAGFSIGYTDEGWNFGTAPTFEENRVDEEEDPVSDFITANETTISGSMRQVLNLTKLAALIPGATYTAPVTSGGAIREKLTGGGKKTFSYYAAALVWPDPNDPLVFWWIMLYKCLNRGGIEFGLGRTRNSAANVTLTGRAVSGRTAGDRVFAIVRYEDVP